MPVFALCGVDFFLLLFLSLFCFLVFGTVTAPQDCEACPNANLFHCWVHGCRVGFCITAQ